jgi:hypothetical protein
VWIQIAGIIALTTCSRTMKSSSGFLIIQSLKNFSLSKYAVSKIAKIVKKINVIIEENKIILTHNFRIFAIFKEFCLLGWLIS